MFGENPVRFSVTPISSAIDRKRFLNTSKSIGATRISARNHVSETVDPESKIGRHDNGRVSTRDDGGPARRCTGFEILPAVVGGPHRVSIETRAPRRCGLGFEAGVRAGERKPGLG